MNLSTIDLASVNLLDWSTINLAAVSWGAMD